MKIKPTTNDWRLAREIHGEFAKKGGADHIASLFALAHLAALCRSNQVRTIFEAGAGIGTMTYLMLRMLPDARITCTEPNEFCRQQLAVNIPAEWQERLRVIPRYVPEGQTFELLVMDGGTKAFDGMVAEGSICFAEGSRGESRGRVTAEAKSHGLELEMTNHAPRPLLYWKWKRLWKGGIRTPRPRWRPRKGCWVGRVTRP